MWSFRKIHGDILWQTDRRDINTRSYGSSREADLITQTGSAIQHLNCMLLQAGVAIVCSGTYCSGYMDTKHGDFKYFTQLSIETPNMVRHLFPLSDDPKENFIAGFSMGGYGTLKFWMLREPEKFAAFGLFSGIKNVPDILPEKEDDIRQLLCSHQLLGNRKNVKGTEDDVVYMIKKTESSRKKISTRIYGNWS